MARFSAATEANFAKSNGLGSQANRFPFHNIYACKEGRNVFVNMEAVPELQAGMQALRDICLIVDISGSMYSFYQNGSVEKMCTQIVDSLASFDDDGIDLFFFSTGLIFNSNVSSAQEVKKAIIDARMAPGAFGGTMPAEAFNKFCNQIKQKGRCGTVLFLTDGIMDDRGNELQSFYKNVLHTQFKTRDSFYCYAIEFGRTAFGALDVLDGLYSPEGGPEDLFDLGSANELDTVAEELRQIGGMSAVGSDVSINVRVDKGVMTMVNTDLIEGGNTVINGAINQIMSFQIEASGDFSLTVTVPGFSPLIINAHQKEHEVDLTIV